MSIYKFTKLSNLFDSNTAKLILDSAPVIILVRILFFIAFIKITHVFIDNVTNKFLQKIEDSERKKQIQTVKHIIRSTADITLAIIFLMALLTRLGIDIRPFLTAAGVLGVAVGFGAKRFFEDIISGIIILLEGQIRVGDVIEITDKIGVVEHLNLKMVVLRDLHGRVHYVRNGMIDIVTNLTRDYSYCVMEIGIAYKENIDEVINVIEKIFYEQLVKSEKVIDYILDELEMLGVESLDDSAVKIAFRVKTKPMKQWAVKREFNRLIKNKFDELGIEIPFPQTTIHLSKEEKRLEKIIKN